MKPASLRAITLVFLIAALLFIGGQLFGAQFIENDWSFTHWPGLGYTYGLIWLAVLAATLFGVSLFARSGRLPEKPSQLEWPLLAALATMLLVFQFDSVLYSGGNLRIAQIAQAERIIFRWFEIGTVALVAGLHFLTDLLPVRAELSGLLAWKIFSFTCSAAAIFGVVKLSHLLSSDRLKRLALAPLALFGGHTLVLFGFVGIAPAVVAVMIWFTVLAVKITKQQIPRDKLLLWIVVLGGILLHYSLLVLLPSAVFLTVATARVERRRYMLAKLAALVTLGALIVLHMQTENRSLEYAARVLTLGGRLPFTDYGILSLRHLSDIVQLGILAAPLFLVIFPFAFSRPGIAKVEPAIWSGWFLMISSLLYVFVYNPVNSIVLDSPALAAYFTPMAVLLCLYVGSLDFAEVRERRLGLSLAAFALLVPLAYLPNYVSIKRSEPFTTAYLDQHTYYYRTAVASYRDAYFARKEFSDADRWEWQWESKSPEVLNLRGTANLAGRNEIDPALRNLSRMIAGDPFWTEPRDLLAKTLIGIKRFNPATAQIDTAMQIEPYGKPHLVNRYILLRSMGNFPGALEAANRAHEYYPKDIEIRTDQMLLTYRAGNLEAADQLADELLARDSARAFAYLIKGFAEEKRGQTQEAINRYEQFARLAPDEPETPVIRQRIERLKSAAN